jgi:hypothetical protein
LNGVEPEREGDRSRRVLIDERREDEAEGAGMLPRVANCLSDFAECAAPIDLGATRRRIAIAIEQEDGQ